MKFKQPSLGTKAAIFLPFLISWTRAHLRMAELGCLASIPLHRKPTAFQGSLQNVAYCDNLVTHEQGSAENISQKQDSVSGIPIKGREKTCMKTVTR